MTRKIFFTTLAVAALTTAALTAAPAPPKPAPLPPAPPVPEVLKSYIVSLTQRRDVGLTLTLAGTNALDSAQWDAIAALKVRSFNFTGPAINDDAIARIAAMNPESLYLGHSPMSDTAAAKFAEMKSLKSLIMSHTDRLTPKAAAALANHPALEVFANDGTFGIGGMAQIATAPKLRQVLFQHGVASDANAAAIAKHPALEIVRLWPSGTAAFTDAGIAPLATIPNLKELSISLSVLTYDGGLKHLKNATKLERLALFEVALPEADLAKLKADLPGVKISFTPMKPEYRAQWDAWAAKKK
jgi:hypothetical protein